MSITFAFNTSSNEFVTISIKLVTFTTVYTIAFPVLQPLPKMEETSKTHKMPLFAKFLFVVNKKKKNVKKINGFEAEVMRSSTGKYRALANPISLFHEAINQNRKLAVSFYMIWLQETIKKDGKTRAAFLDLVERVLKEQRIKLICCCAPKLCHANALKDAIVDACKESWKTSNNTDKNKRFSADEAQRETAVTQEIVLLDPQKNYMRIIDPKLPIVHLNGCRCEDCKFDNDEEVIYVDPPTKRQK